MQKNKWKNYYLSEPYIDNDTSTYIERESITEAICAAWLSENQIQPLNPILIGPPGMGKNKIVSELAKKKNKELYIFQGHEDISVDDMMCSVKFSANRGIPIRYILSPITTAVIKGGILFIDEIGKIRPRALNVLMSLLDTRRYLDINLIGERIKAHSDFRFIAASNSLDMVENMMPEFIKSRLKPVIPVGQYSTEEINKIVSYNYSSLNRQQTKSLLDEFWVNWNKYKANGGSQEFPSLRDVESIFNLATSLAKLRNKKNQKIKPADINKAFSLTFPGY